MPAKKEMAPVGSGPNCIRLVVVETPLKGKKVQVGLKGNLFMFSVPFPVQPQCEQN